MTNNLYLFNKDAKTYYDLYKNSLEKNDYFSCFKYIRNAISADKSEPEYILELGKLYSDIGMLDSSKQCLFELIKKSQLLKESYFILAKNAVKANKISEFACYMRHYTMLDKDGVLLDDDDFFDDYIIPVDEEDFLELENIDSEEINDESIFGEILNYEAKPRFRLVGGKEDKKKFYDGLFSKMGDLVKKGKFDEAIKTGEDGHPENEDGVKCYNAIALCYYFKDDFEKAIEVALKAYKKCPNDCITLSNLVIFYGASGDSKSKEEIIQKIKGLDLDDINDVYKISLSFLDICDYDDAIEFLLKVEQELPYDCENLLFLAISYYNIGKFEASLDYAFKGLTIMPRNLQFLYVRDKAKAAKESKAYVKINFKEIIPIKKLKQYALLLEKEENLRKAICAEDELFEAVLTFILELRNSTLPYATIDNIFNMYDSAQNEVLNFLSGILCSTVIDNLKQYIIKNLILRCDTYCFFVNNSGVLNKFYYVPISGKIFNKTWQEVYVEIFSLMCVLTVNFEKEIIQSIKETHRRLKAFTKEFSFGALCAVTLFKSSVPKIYRGKKFLLSVFDCESKEFNKIVKTYREQGEK